MPKSNDRSIRPRTTLPTAFATGNRSRRSIWRRGRRVAVDVERADFVATVTMNRPDALNAFNSDQLNELLDIFRSLRDDRTVRCVILTGAGEKAFAAGADIKEMAE